jgi:Ca-activated chloride channel homolog
MHISRYSKSVLWTVLLMLSSASTPTLPPLARSLQARPESGLVSVSVAVTSRTGELIQGIRPTDFTVYSDDIPQTITHFSAGKSPSSIIFLVDQSGSMGSRFQRNTSRIRFAPASLARYFAANQVENEYAVISFGKEVQVALGWTKNAATLVDRVKELSAGQSQGHTALYEACFRAVELSHSGSYSKKAIVILSDGEDNLGAYKDEDRLRELIRRSGILVYGLDPSCIPLNTLERNYDSCRSPNLDASPFISQVAVGSGGLAFRPTRETDLDAAVSYLFTHLRVRYQLSFKPSHPAGDKKFHRIRITVSPPPGIAKDLRKPSVNHCEGYYAPSNQ